MSKNGLRVALFCGGRGSASITRALLSRSDLCLSLIINGFDDGRSTGVVRKLIPGLLGPSDFRKNLSYVLNPQAPQQMAMRCFIEKRLISSRQLFGTDGLLGFASHGDTARLSPHLSRPLSQLEVPCRERVREHLYRFFEYIAGNERALACRDISVGNLLFAGIYLETRDFNAAIRRFGELCSAAAEILNVTDGACRWLIALKENGELLACESDIVSPQSPIPIANLYLLEYPVGPAEQLRLAPLSFQEKHAWLRERDMPVDVSTEAANAIVRADVIIYGPGTQHSSLLPSYRVAASAIRKSRALLKVLIINLDRDHDIQGLSATDIREGDECLPGSLGDVGTFVLSAQHLASVWSEYRQQQYPGARTAEINFLPFLVFLAQRGWEVKRLRVDDPLEARGINTAEDLAFFQRLYAG
jgi:2-phospho-L-lactate transferase/gluconeogenesis factor (CofD/UPF0052 family)